MFNTGIINPTTCSAGQTTDVLQFYGLKLYPTFITSVKHVKEMKERYSIKKDNVPVFLMPRIKTLIYPGHCL